MVQHTENAKNVVDGIAIATTLGTLMEVLPSVSAALSIVWLLIRIWETDTVQGWIKKDAKHE